MSERNIVDENMVKIAIHEAQQVYDFCMAKTITP
jgi:hypothetical protein